MILLVGSAVGTLLYLGAGLAGLKWLLDKLDTEKPKRQS